MPTLSPSSSAFAFSSSSKRMNGLNGTRSKVISPAMAGAAKSMKGKSKQSRRRDSILGDSDDDNSVYGNSYTSSGMGYGSSSYQESRPAPLSASFAKGPHLAPRNELQRQYIAHLESAHPTIVVATGAAGTGKTMIASTMAVKKLVEGTIDKLVITRPMVNVDDGPGIGFLPGTLEEKCSPWLMPLTDVFYKYMTPARFQGLIAKQVIEICPLEMMRGRSFENAFIIVDEAQNCTPTQMLMLLTRIGEGSKLVITGDPMQHDRRHRSAGNSNGLEDLITRIQTSAAHNPERVDDIAMVHFTEDCIVRHPIIRSILKMYDVKYPPTA